MKYIKVMRGGRSRCRSFIDEFSEKCKEDEISRSEMLILVPNEDFFVSRDYIHNYKIYKWIALVVRTEENKYLELSKVDEDNFYREFVRQHSRKIEKEMKKRKSDIEIAKHRRFGLFG